MDGQDEQDKDFKNLKSQILFILSIHVNFSEHLNRCLFTTT
jgi:hypothetical protein